MFVFCSSFQQALTNAPAANSSFTAPPFYDSEPPFLAIGTEVSAKYKGAFCEARIQKVQRLVKCRVTFRNSLGSAVITDDNIKGTLRVGATVEAKHPDKSLYYEATISKIIDASLYTVVFDDGDVTTLRRTSLCLKSGKHFSESESLDHLPLTNPEHFGNPVTLRARGTRKRRRRSVYGNPTLSDNDDADSYDGLASGGSVDDEDSNTNSLQKAGKDDLDDVVERRDPDCGKLICVDYADKRNTKLKDGWFPALIVHPSAQDNSQSKIDLKEDHLVKSFINGRFYQLPRKDAKEFTKEIATQTLHDSSASSTLKSSVEKALLYMEKDELPSNWDYDLLIGSSVSNEATEDGNISSDLEFLLDEDDNDDDCKTNEEKDRFVAQLYKFMDERGTPINKTPNVGGKDLDLYTLYRLVSKLGGYNRVTNKNGWKAIYNKLNLPNNSEPILGESNHNQLKLAYKKFLLNFVDFYRKLGCTMVNTCLFARTSGRTARSDRNWRTTSESKETPKMRRKKLSGTDSSSSLVKELDREKEPDEQHKTNEAKTTSGPNVVVPNPTISGNTISSGTSAPSTLTATTTLLPVDDDDKSQTSLKKSVKKPRKNARKKYKLIDPDDSSVNGNEPEEKYIPGDSDSESDAEYQSKTPTIAKDVPVVIGDRIRVKYGKGKQLKVYEAKVLKNNQEHDDSSKCQYFVHYTGWNIRYDEWIKRSRIVEVVKDKSPKRRGGAKSKNKGVPLVTTEDVKDEVKEATKDAVTAGKDTPLITSKRSRSSSTSIKAEKMSKEDKIRRELERKLAAQASKRTRQRSDCTEIASDHDESPETLAEEENLLSANAIKQELDSNADEIESSPKAKSKSDSEQAPSLASDRISLDDFNAEKDLDSPEAIESSTMSSETSDSKSIGLDATLIKKELLDSVESSDPSVESGTSTTTSSCSRSDSVESGPIVSDGQTSESSGLVNKNVKNSLDVGKKISKRSDNNERAGEVKSVNDPPESNAGLPESETSSIEECNLTRQSSKTSSVCSMKSDEDSQRKRKTRKGQNKERGAGNKVELEVDVKKKKVNVNHSSNEDEEEKEEEVDHGPTVSSSEDHHENTENVMMVVLKRKRFGNRSFSECERIDVKGTKRQRSTSESEPAVSTPILISDQSAKKAEESCLDQTTTSAAVSCQPEKERVDEPEVTFAMESTSADIAAASFLLCKEEIPASPVCESVDDVESGKKSKGDKPSADQSGDSDQKTSQGPAAATLASLKSAVTEANNLVCENSLLGNDTASNEISRSVDEELVTTNTTTTAAELSPEHKQNEPVVSAKAVKQLDDQSTKDTGHTKDFITMKSNDGGPLRADQKSQKHDSNESNDPADLRKANEENIEMHLEDSVISSPRKKRRGRIRTGSHCESLSMSASPSHAGNSNNHSSTNGISNTMIAASTHSKDTPKESLRGSAASGCKTRGSMSRRVKHNSSNSAGGGGGGDSNIGHSDHLLDSNDPLSPGLCSSNLPAHFEYQPISKYNFVTPIDNHLDSERRIQILQERLQEVRKTYLHIKAEVGSLDRKRKKLKRKERSSPSSPGSSSQHSDQKGSGVSGNGGGSGSTKDSQRSQSNSDDASGTEEGLDPHDEHDSPDSPHLLLAHHKHANGSTDSSSALRPGSPRVDKSAMLPNLVTVLKAGEILSERA